MAMTKKGMFFTFAAIALSIIIILSFHVYQSYEMKEDMEVVSVRINTMNNFIKDVEQDLEKGLYIASFRAFVSMTEFIINNGSYIENLEQSFNEIILNGTLGNQELNLMQNSTFTDWSDKIAAQAEKIDVSVNFSITNVNINQTEPWSVIVKAYINTSVVDKKGTSSWKRTNAISTEISIIDLEDPLYIVNGYGIVTNPIVMTPISNFVQGDDATNLNIHLNNSYYIASNSSPNFLMRLQGDLSNSSTGIESLVNLKKFQDQGIPIKDRSAVDYIYFGTQSTTNYRINKTPSWFKLDSEHLETYQAQDIKCEVGDICVTD